MQVIEVGENALVLSVEGNDTAECVKEIRKLSSAISNFRPPELSSIRYGLDCLMLEFKGEFDRAKLLEIVARTSRQQRTSKLPTLRVPVCYEPPFARDIQRVADFTGLTLQQIMELHTARMYEVWMIGFMPGYPYMGAVDERLRMPRKDVPDLLIPAGSVAIADEYVGVYPFDSPGGWNVIGRTPVTVVDYSRTPAFLFEYGMTVEFYPISTEEFQKL